MTLNASELTVRKLAMVDSGSSHASTFYIIKEKNSIINDGQSSDFFTKANYTKMGW